MTAAKNKVVVVTGASSGIGRAFALEMGRRGAKVALLSRRAELLKETAKEIKATGGDALVLPTDITDAKEVRTAFEHADSKYGHIDILFNAAGVLEPISPLIHATDKEIAAAVNTNYLGLCLVTREAARKMVEQSDGGTVIHVSSGAAHSPRAGWVMYCSSKAAMDMVTQAVAKELEPTPVRIAAIAPGIFESDMQKTIRSQSKGDFPSVDWFVELHESGKMVGPDVPAKFIADISLSDWPELNGRVDDVRDSAFQKDCLEHGIQVPPEFAA